MTASPTDTTAPDITAVPAHLRGSRAAIFHLLRQSPDEDTKTGADTGDTAPAEGAGVLSHTMRRTAAAKPRRPVRRGPTVAAPQATAEAMSDRRSPASPVRRAAWACLDEEDCFQFRSVSERRGDISL